MKQKTANEKDPSAPLGMTIRECAFLTFLFIPLRKPTSAPSDRLLPAEGWNDARVPLSSKGYKKTQPMRAALSDFKNYTLKRK